ncbi:MAG: DNA polymerase I [Syntrophales bacterium]
MDEEKKDKPTLYLIDGSNYIYRAFYAIKRLSNSRGFPTNAIYGFTNMLMKLFREWAPQYIAVVFDSRGPTFRSESYEQYKAHRPGMPDELIPQIPYIKEIIRGFSLPVLEQEGLEADDIIASIAKQCAAEGVKVVIVSGDKDLLQLISGDILMIDTMKDKTYDVEGVKARFGVEPSQVAEVLGLTGDASDNIPGVPGIGEKTAVNLIRQFGSIEGVLQNTGKLGNPRIRESLEKNAEQARMSRDLIILRTDLDMNFRLEDARYTGPNKKVLRDIFKELEFSSLIRDLNMRDELRGLYGIIESHDELENLLGKIKEAGEFAFCPELDSETPMIARIVGISLSPSPEEAFYVPFPSPDDPAPGNPGADFILDRLRPFFGDGGIKKYGHDLKNSIVVLSRCGIEMKGIGSDVMVASYVLNPSKRSHDLTEIARDYLNRELAPLKELVGGGVKKTPFEKVPREKAMLYSCSRVDAVFKLAVLLADKIREGGFESLFYEIELPLIEVLASMEARGVLVDRVLLEEMSEQFDQLLSASEEKIYRMAGERFNIHSPKQLQRILFEKLGLSRGRRTKNGYSTDMDVLANLAQNHELPAEILSYRSIAKLKSTYIDALPAMINPRTGRIHTSYNQTVTATGRLSSSDPNLQNIPVRGPEGKRIREAFIAPEGMEIVSADYSQIELRVLAHLSGDRALIEIFRADEDIHARTAADVFGVLPGMVTQDMRRQAKVINFGILYGMSPFGLARELGITQSLARDYIDRYFSEFQGVKKYIHGILENARKDGYVTTLLNRRRYVPEINSGNAAVRQFAERAAVNTPIQGTAADLIKVAMIRISRRLARERREAGMIMQVHDELVFEVPLNEKKDVMELIRHEMENVAELSVPLKVEISSGKNWGEAH